MQDISVKMRCCLRKRKKIVAYHEVGHALVAAKQSNSAPVAKITIVPRTSGALGYTMQVDSGERFLMSRKELENKIATLTGGRAAEELSFRHSITTGASNDIEQATKLARAMITQYGMSDDFDMVALETVSKSVLGRRRFSCLFGRNGRKNRRYGSGTDSAHATPKGSRNPSENRQKLDEIAQFLYKKETITGEEFMEILNRN